MTRLLSKTVTLINPFAGVLVDEDVWERAGGWDCVYPRTYAIPRFERPAKREARIKQLQQQLRIDTERGAA